MPLIICLSNSPSKGLPSVMTHTYQLDLGQGYVASVQAEILDLPHGKFVRLPLVEPQTLVAQVALAYFR